jgi:hypothetical protein
MRDELNGWWVSYRGRSVGRRIQVYELTEDGTVVKYRHRYHGSMKPSSMLRQGLEENYRREEDQ